MESIPEMSCADLSCSELSWDASAGSWEDFLRALLDIRSARELGGLELARVSAPAQCTAEARRVIRDLGLDDCVELVAHVETAGHGPYAGQVSEPLLGLPAGDKVPTRLSLARMLSGWLGGGRRVSRS